MEIQLNSNRARLRVEKKLSDLIIFDLSSSNEKCFDITSETALRIVNALLLALEINSRVVVKSRYEIETV